MFLGADDPKANPFDVVQAWMAHARDAGEIEVDAADLATVDAEGMPNIRIVYIREFEANGFVFYTNYQSQKGAELASGKAAFNLYYKALQWQIRVRGDVEKVSAAQSDAYFFARPKESRLGAWASQQSRPLASREQLITEWEALPEARANERPPHWGGYRVIPSSIEFWQMGAHRLHNRFLWTRNLLKETPWQIERLYP